MPPLEVWEKYFIPSVDALGEDHQIGCIACHGGTSGVDEMEAAHQGMSASVSDEPDKGCGGEGCHQEITDLNDNSLHFNLGGYDTIMGARGADFNNPATSQAFDKHCTECHSDCGQCHVSRPKYAGGGLIAGHQFKKIAPVTITCDGCHGSRVTPEYKGRNEGIPGDIHWSQAGMACVKCHPVGEMHGDGNNYSHRYDGEAIFSCVSAGCHPAADLTGIEQHDLHGDKLACQVCHSAGEYKNCANCHVGTDDKGLPYRTLDPSWMDFKIGRNPNPTKERPWQYQLVRHIPVTPSLFGDYGENLLPNFDAVPTWKETTPHNIQTITPQNETCEACHENPDIFLMADDVAPEEQAANSEVIVLELPGMSGTIGELEATNMLHPLEGYQHCTACHQEGQARPVGHPLEDRADCFFCHREGVAQAPKFPGGHNDFTVNDCLECHLLTDQGVMTSTAVLTKVVPTIAEVSGQTETRPLLNEDQIAGVECYECHEAEVYDWSQTTHAIGAHTEGFLQAWEDEDRSAECLRCHTSGFNEATGEFHFDGVGCEACHGEMLEGHGDEELEEAVTMPIPVDDSVCASCHQFTYDEWRISGHAGGNVSCISCHLAHVQGVRLPAEELCQACHQEMRDNFAHATHLDIELAADQEPITCIECHMHAPNPDSNQVEGTGAVGHNFFVGTEACARCHEETAHLKRDAIAQQLPPPSIDAAALAEAEVARLEQCLEDTQEQTVSVLSMGLGIGGVIGVAVILFLTRRSPRRNKK